MTNNTEIRNNTLNTVLHDLLERIAQVFSVVCNLVGKKRFHVISDGFIRQMVMTKKDFLDFPAYIENCGDSNHMPYLPDVARLELQRNNALLAKDDDPSQMSSNVQAQKRFRLKNSVHLVASDWPVDKIYHHCKSLDCFKNPPSFKPQSVFLAIWRANRQTHMQRLSTLEYLAMLDLRSEQSTSNFNLAKTQNSDFNIDAFLEKQLSLKTIQRI